MPTKFNLNIDSRTSDDMSGDGVTQNTNIRSEDPNELIAILQKLSGQTPAHAHEEPVAAPVVKVAAQELPAGTMRAIMQKSGLGALPGHEHAEEASCGAMMESEDDLDDSDSKSSMYTQGYEDAEQEEEPDPIKIRDREYMRGYRDGTQGAGSDPRHPWRARGGFADRVRGKPRRDNMSAGGRERDYEGDPQPLSGEFDFSESAVNEALANAPNPKTMKDLLDIVNTDHTASIPNKVTKAGHGDNPLPKSDEQLMEDRLMQEWRSEKINHYATQLNQRVANVAIVENRNSFVDGTREYAIRKGEGFIKVYPVIENRVMTQSPVYVVQEEFGRDMKHLLSKTGPGDGRGVDRKLSRDDRFSPSELERLEKPAIQRSGDMEEPVPHDLTKPKYDRMGRRLVQLGEEEDDGAEKLRDLWNRYTRHWGTAKDPSEDTEAKSRAKIEARDIVDIVTDEYGPEVAYDMKRFAQHKLSYEETGNRRHDDTATELMDKYTFSKSFDTDDQSDEENMDADSEEDMDSSDEIDFTKDKYDPYDKRLPPILRRQATEALDLTDLRAAVNSTNTPASSTNMPKKGKDNDKGKGKDKGATTGSKSKVDLNALRDMLKNKKVDEAKKKAKNKYAIGMAAAMNATGDKPPLKKSTITKAHKIADKIKEGSKKK